MVKIHFGEYVFEGPYSNTSDLENKPGVYVILCSKEKCYFPIDVGETDAVKSRIKNSEQKKLWKWHCNGVLKFSVLYAPGIQEVSRAKTVQKLRTWYNLSTVEQT